jgi:uncharacterized membrane protein YtjA (UPF0391 family)
MVFRKYPLVAPDRAGTLLALTDRSYHGPKVGPQTTELVMLYWAAVFFVIAVLAALFGFFGLAAGAAGIAKILFFVFLVLAVITLITGRRASI